MTRSRLWKTLLPLSCDRIGVFVGACGGKRAFSDWVFF